MSKRILLLTIVMTLLTVSFISCGDLEYIAPTDTADTSPTENVPETPLSEVWVPLSNDGTDDEFFAVSAMADIFTDTRDLVVFSDNRDAVINAYFNKSTGNVYPLCTDPLCAHSEDKEKCAASWGGQALASGLSYDKNDGILYMAKALDSSGNGDGIFSLSIDKMDTALHGIYKNESGDGITSMKYSDGIIYFTKDYYEEETEEYGTVFYSIGKDGSEVTEIVKIPSGGVTDSYIRNGIIYYSNPGDFSLYSYDIENGNVNTVIQGTENSKYYLWGNNFLSMSTSGIYLYDENGEKETLYAPENESYDFCADVSDGVLYFCGYSPEEYVDANLGTRINYSGGRIFRLIGGEAELLYEFGNDAIINHFDVIDGAIFVKILRGGKHCELKVIFESGSEIISYDLPSVK